MSIEDTAKKICSTGCEIIEIYKSKKKYRVNVLNSAFGRNGIEKHSSKNKKGMRKIVMDLKRAYPHADIICYPESGWIG